MQNKTILIACAIFSISILLMHNNIEKAFAIVEIFNITTFNNPTFTYSYDSGTTKYLAVVISNTAVTPKYVEVYNLASHALIARYNITLLVDGTLPHSATIVDMYCRATLCYIISDVGGASSRGTVTEINIATGASQLGYEEVAPYSTPAGGAVVVRGDIENTVFYFVTDGADTYYRVLNTSTSPFTLVTTVDLNTGNGGVLDAETATISTVNTLVFSTQVATNQLQIWDIGTSSRICQATVTTSLREFENIGSLWYIIDSEEVEIYNNACVDSGTILQAQFCDDGGTEPIRAIEYNSVDNILYANCDENVALPRIVLVNVTSGLRITSYNLEGASSQTHDTISYLSGTDSLSISMGATDQIKIIYFSGVDFGSAEVCIDTTLDGIVDLCFIDTNNDGVADNGSSGSLGAFNSNANVTDMGTQWFCAFNLGNACNDSDVRTNGVGMFYLLVVIILSYAFLVAIHMKAVELAGKSNVTLVDSMKINPVLLLVMLFVDVGLTWYLQWIADIVFYSLVVVIILIGGFAIYSKVKGGDNA